jgi:hypothetical protein
MSVLITIGKPLIALEGINDALNLAAPTIDANALCSAWGAADDEIASVDAMNLASVVQFLDHAAQLDGLQTAEEALAKGRWRQLPYWLASCWLPVDAKIDDQRELEGEPVFIGSAPALLVELAEIAALSPHNLGHVPEQYQLDFDEPLDQQAALQWVWRAFFDAAMLAVEHNVPMST